MPKKQGYVDQAAAAPRGARRPADGRCTEPFLYQLVPKVAEMMRGPYPELSETTGRVAQVIQKEESNFFATIDAGLDRIERVFAGCGPRDAQTVSGVEAAEMYTTHGFPPELFETLAAEHNLGFDWEGFRAGDGTARRSVRRRPAQASCSSRARSTRSRKRSTATTFLGYETIDRRSDRSSG